MSVTARVRRVGQGVLARSIGVDTRKSFLGVPIDCLTLSETSAIAEHAMRTGRLVQHSCINVAKFVAMQSDEMLADSVRSSHVVSVDGMGIVWAARLLNLDVPERVAGIDLMDSVLRLCAMNGYRPFFLGARQNVLRTATSKALAHYPGLQFAGWHHGYFKAEEEADVVATIRNSGADCLFVAMPSPRKEQFLAQHRTHLGVPFIMGVGGAADVLAGYVRRAPNWVQAIGLEWLFRMIQEPRRLGPRYLRTNTAFGMLLAKALIVDRASRWAKRMGSRAVVIVALFPIAGLSYGSIDQRLSSNATEEPFRLTSVYDFSAQTGFCT
jgi:N-acetylglucosaminyldiphosphoundecaprenol N-acetyl-beta-D-mannosaminyltransferase